MTTLWDLQKIEMIYRFRPKRSLKLNFSELNLKSNYPPQCRIWKRNFFAFLSHVTLNLDSRMLENSQIRGLKYHEQFLQSYISDIISLRDVISKPGKTQA